ncbi:MAG: NADH:ubiquinone oxidoreductase subunit NDUFA12 [Pseudomonadota bacterium]
MGIFQELFTWWNGQTMGTRVFTARRGRLVGEDEQGNRYYRTADDARRWVVYNGEAEASKVPPDWHGWLHRTYENPPTEAPLPRKEWEKPHLENRTGSVAAYHPPGSLTTPEARPKVAGDYQAWEPK